MTKTYQVVTALSPIFGENSYLVYDPESREAALVDPGYPLSVLDEAMERLNLSVRDIVLTHGHVDHISGVGYYRAKTGGRVWLPKAEEDVVRQTQIDYKTDVPMVTSVQWDETYQDGDRVGALGFHAFAAPGHTAGSCILMLSDLCFTGDTIFAGSVGRSDLYTGDEWKLADSIRRFFAQAEDESVIYPGHGESTTVERERRTNPFVLAWMKRGKDGIHPGSEAHA